MIIGQLPKVFGFSVKADGLVEKLHLLIQGMAGGRAERGGLRHRAGQPGHDSADTALATPMARRAAGGGRGHGPECRLRPGSQRANRRARTDATRPARTDVAWIGWSDLMQLLPGAAIIAMLSFADTSVLSRALAARGNYRVSQNQEMIALGVANIAAGVFQGFSISSSASRTPVAESAGARTQLTGLVGAVAIAPLLIFAPALLGSLPSASLGAVVIAACLTFADLPGMLGMYRQRRVEFALSVISFVGVAFVGVIEGIVITIALAMLVLVWNAWHPHSAVLVRVDGRKGYHDVKRHPEGRPVPGLEIFRWDAQLFFANAEIFRYRVLQVVQNSPTPPTWLIVAADAITDVDITAADVLNPCTANCSRDWVWTSPRDEGAGQGPAGALRTDGLDRGRPLFAHRGQCRQPLSQPA